MSAAVDMHARDIKESFTTLCILEVGLFDYLNYVYNPTVNMQSYLSQEKVAP